MDKMTLNIPDISCNHCLMTIRRESSFVDGVEFVEGDVVGRTATFHVSSDTALANLRRTLAEAGYPVAE